MSLSPDSQLIPEQLPVQLNHVNWLTLTAGNKTGKKTFALFEHENPISFFIRNKIQQERKSQYDTVINSIKEQKTIYLKIKSIIDKLEEIKKGKQTILRTIEVVELIKELEKFNKNRATSKIEKKYVMLMLNFVNFHCFKGILKNGVATIIFALTLVGLPASRKKYQRARIFMSLYKDTSNLIIQYSKR